MKKFEPLSILIKASADRIWSTITDIDRYGDWNSIVPRGSGVLIEGNILQIDLQLPGKDQETGLCRVEKVKADHYFVLSRTLKAKWILYLEHAFILEPLNQRNQYRFVQTLKGSGILWWFLQHPMHRVWQQFERFNLDLKRYVEKTIRHGSSKTTTRNKAAFQSL